MKLARRAFNDADRKLDLEERPDEKILDLVAEANDTGYGTEETVEALDEVVDNHKIIYAEDPDPADDPPPEQVPGLRIPRASSR